MKRIIRLISLGATIAAFALSSILGSSASAQAQQRSGSATTRRPVTTLKSAYERGYTAGYNDGYLSGKSDYNAHAARDHQASDLYQQANRGYETRFGDLSDYQEGYRLGYEIAYTDGYYGRPMAAQVPRNALAMRKPATTTPPSTAATSDRPRAGAGVIIPNDTILTLRLKDTISTKTSKSGDSFTATVISPKDYEEATVTGHIAKVNRSGKMTGRTEMALEFDSITLSNGRSSVLHGQVEKIHASESVKSVDEEGNIESSNKSKDTTIRTGGGAAIGAIIGAVAGGGKGAAIGAILGAGVGAGSVYIQGNKDLVLEPGTEMTVRTSAPPRTSTRR
jgi:hypothetical protein